MRVGFWKLVVFFFAFGEKKKKIKDFHFSLWCAVHSSGEPADPRPASRDATAKRCRKASGASWSPEGAKKSEPKIVKGGRARETKIALKRHFSRVSRAR